MSSPRTPHETRIKEYARFGMTGVLNTATDFIVLNALLVASGPAVSYPAYAAFKIASFAAAVGQSYFLNRHWVFGRKDGKIADLSEGGRFFAVSAVGFFINILSSSIAFAALAGAGIPDRFAGNAGAALGTILVMLWNYSGYRSFVFKETKSP